MKEAKVVPATMIIRDGKGEIDNKTLQTTLAGLDRL